MIEALGQLSVVILERAPRPPLPPHTPGEASEELGEETCAVKEAVNMLSHQVCGYWRKPGLCS